MVNDAQGVSSFQALQNAFETGKATRITYYLFDLPYLNGADLREVPVEQRRELLGKLLEESNDSELLRFSAAFEVPADRILASACELGLEGVIGKRLGSPYRSRRNKDWIKLKCAHRQEFIIVGYTPPRAAASTWARCWWRCTMTRASCTMPARSVPASPRPCSSSCTPASSR